MIKLLCFVVCAVGMMGCTPTLTERIALAQEYAHSCGMKQTVFDGREFDILGYVRPGTEPGLRLYIEGDGLAWFRPNVVSDDPTPTDPVALKLACQDDFPGTVVYVARPCQFGHKRGCHPNDWTYGRYSKRIIDTYHDLVVTLLNTYKETKVDLVGYSGGAQIAIYIAHAFKQNIRQLVTVAGVLDHEAWTAHHHYAPLHASIPSSGGLARLCDIPQRHLIGRVDTQVSPDLSLRLIEEAHCPKSRSKMYPLSHQGPWEEDMTFSVDLLR